MNLNDPVSAIMTTDVVVVDPSQKLLDVKHLFEKKKFHHHIPVVENGKLQGMVSLVDYMRAIGNATLDDSDGVYHALQVKDIMSTSPVVRPPETTIKEAAEELTKGNVHALVIYEKGEVKGIVSTTDVIRFFLKAN